MFHYVLCRYITNPLIISATAPLFKKTHSCKKSSSAVLVSTQTFKIVVLHQQVGLFPFSSPVPCGSWKLLIFLLKSTEGSEEKQERENRAQSFFFSFQFELAQPVIWPEINIWATFPLGLQRPDFNICFGSSISIKVNPSNWINIFDCERLSYKTRSHTADLYQRRVFWTIDNQ